MTRLRLLIDADEVLVSLMDEWLRVYNRWSGDTVQREGITHYDLENWPWKDPKLFWLALDRSPVMRMAQPMPGAVAAFKRLYMAHDARICTFIRPEGWGRGMEQRLGWCWDWFREPGEHKSWFNREHIMTTREKWPVHADVLVDDAAHNLTAWANQWPDKQAYCIDSPWNRDAVFPSNVKRVSSLAEVADELCGVEG